MEQLENIWSRKSFSSTQDGGSDINRIYKKIELKNLHQRQKNIFLVKAAIVFFILISASVALYNFNKVSYIGAVLYILFLLETSAIFFLYSRQKFNLNDDTFALPAGQFVDKILKNLSREKVFIKLWLNLYALIIVIQLNILLWFSAGLASALPRIILHLLVTSFIGIVFLFSLKRRIKRYNKEVKPLVEEFIKMKSELSGITA